ncbi:putative pentatricopeptide repeat-containing protein At5g37570 isoform X2 [Neltuma alba]|uniref:putative pentatricopeptide repeat-containing protein At5g37570 isoform X2 n=1 Tax=Neltuma alba TaxID=207710 RepID=UPI0010A3E93F|nr:putative pentatricopeptide repeat-containing protein At5g37570 isoform X2 [Prosopis alba]
MSHGYQKRILIYYPLFPFWVILYSSQNRTFCKCWRFFPMLSTYSLASTGCRLLKFSGTSIISILKVCKTLEQLYQVHAQIISKGLEQDHDVIAKFISLSNSLAPLNYSKSVFDRVIRPNTLLWNSLIRGYCQQNFFVNVLNVFLRMKREACLSDNYTFPPVIKACSNLCIVWEGKSIHGSIVRCGFEQCVFVGTSLIDMYGKCGETSDARRVFDEMTERNVVSWTAMVVGYVAVGDVMEAKRLFDIMPQRNVISWNAMIQGFVKVGDLGNARGYVQNGQPNAALRIFLEMESLNVKPDEFILVSLMSACSQLGCIELTRWVDSYVCECFVDLKTNHVMAALMDMNAKSGNLERALKLFEKLPKRDLISYCSMIQGLSIHGHGVEAINLFNKMLTEGIVPDEVAFAIILTACSHSGLVDEGWNYFNSMKQKFCINPSPDHYACMVDLLSRSGHMRAAYELIKSMPIESHAGAWSALVGACKLYNDSNLGEIAANRLLEFNPENAANYVLLSNIYAAAERWLDVSAVRNKMRERGVRKIPGYSQI